MLKFLYDCATAVLYGFIFISSIQFEVPVSSIGLIIGRNGCQIKSIEEESGLQQSAIDISRSEVYRVESWIGKKWSKTR